MFLERTITAYLSGGLVVRVDIKRPGPSTTAVLSES